MQLARVTGTVVATRKSDRLDGLKMLVIQPIDPDGTPTGGYLVATDSTGAGPGEVVLYVTGSSARQTDVTQNRPTDATIMAIVDTVQLDGTVTYQKAETET